MRLYTRTKYLWHASRWVKGKTRWGDYGEPIIVNSGDARAAERKLG